MKNELVAKAMTIKLDNTLPEYPKMEEGYRRAPDRGFRLSPAQAELALRNALRYVPEELHETLAPEFMEELKTRGRIYAYRYRPEGRIYGKPIDEYKGKCIEGKAFQVMIDNNLDFEIALYPYELVTYGETGQPCQNWLQYRLIKKYLEELTENQTLVVESGHPLGLFPSKPTAPRVIITNALMVGMFDNLKDWEIAEELGVANYGQMTAGGWMYIGPQGIVHGTFNTILGAGRKYLGVAERGGHVVATGGGILTVERNIPIIKGSGIVVFLNRDISILLNAKTANRPLIRGGREAVLKLYAERIETYRKCADLIVNPDSAGCIGRILDYYKRITE